MLMFGTLHRLLLAGTCLCVYGTPVPPHSGSVTTVGSTHTTDVKSEPSDTEHVTGLISGAGGGAGPRGRPEGTAPVTRAENGDSIAGGSGPSEAGGAAWSQRSALKRVGSASEMEDAQRQSEAASVPPVDPQGKDEDASVTSTSVFGPTGGRKQLEVTVSATRLTPDGFSASSTAPPPQLSITAREAKDPETEDLETSSPSSTDPPNPGERIQKPTSHSPNPRSAFVSPRTSTLLSIWGHEGATASSLPDPLLPEIGPNLMPREDGPESLWTEAARPGGGESEISVKHHSYGGKTSCSTIISHSFNVFKLTGGCTW